MERLLLQVLFHFCENNNLIFRSLSLIFIYVAGSKSEAQSFYSAKQFAKIIKKLGYRFLNEDSLKSDFKLHNVVATVSLNHLIRLDGLASDSGNKYAPRIFFEIL